MPVFAVSLTMRVGQLPPSDGERMASGRAGIMPIQRARALTGTALSGARRRPLHDSYPVPPRRQSCPRPGEGVKKCWDSQPAAESSLGTGTGTQDGSTFGGPTGKNPAVFVARTRFAWLPVPIRASRTPLVTVPDFFTPSCTRASRKSLIKRPAHSGAGRSPRGAV